MPIHRPRKIVPLRAIHLNLEDVRRIFQRLFRLVDRQGDTEIAQFKKRDDQTEEEFQQSKSTIKSDAFRIMVTIVGEKGDELIGDTEDIFSSPNRPTRIVTIYMSNIVPYRGVAKFDPANSFELLLDFSKPPLLDTKNFVSSPTPNESHLTVTGESEAWVASVVDAVLGVTQDRTRNRRWLHRAFVYDFGLIIFGLPASIYLCWKLSSLITEYMNSVHTFVSALAYIYVVFVTLLIYRALLGYTKWAFPTVELSEEGNQSAKHRGFWSVIMLTLAGSIVWELIKAIL